ncbi:MAG TPA: GtrA family protein [Candidatus Pygmaiobacter gallistercoris]|nr:GtrA family protein [Candidatus Pygmaiobacter gallistercoris]
MIKKLFAFFFDRSLLFFLIIGAANTLVSMIGSQLLLSALGYWGSTALMFTLCSVLSFLFNRRYSFHSTAPLLQSAVRFAVVIAVCYLISFGVSDLLVPFAARALALPLSPEWVTRIAMLVAQVIFTGMNYIGQRLWAFKN